MPRRGRIRLLVQLVHVVEAQDQEKDRCEHCIIGVLLPHRLRRRLPLFLIAREGEVAVEIEQVEGVALV
jgi:hypothetical protein